MSSFKQISPDEFVRSPFSLIGKDWMLITTPDKSKKGGANAMTASWGGLGILWNKPVATIYIRPQRHSFSLAENTDSISLCFFDEDHRDALKLCGTRSGRDMDKLDAAGFSVSVSESTPYIDQAKIVMICKKAYADFLKEDCFVDGSHLSHYPNKDYHKLYILEIEQILIRE